MSIVITKAISCFGRNIKCLFQQCIDDDDASQDVSDDISSSDMFEKEQY
jgi:hypothetical protein